MNADQTLAGQRVVITGGSSSIGAATAAAFAEAGARLVLGARGREGPDDVVSRSIAARGGAIVRPVDCTDARALAAFAAETRDLLGGSDLWFSCEGVGVLGRLGQLAQAADRQDAGEGLARYLRIRPPLQRSPCWREARP